MSNTATTENATAWSARQLLPSSQRVTQWTFAAMRLALLLACLFLLSWVANYNPVSWDLTEEQLYSISAQTHSVLDGLQAPVTLIGFVPSGRDAALERILKAYADASPLLDYELVDPEAQPALAAEYQVREYGTLIAAGSDRVRKAEASDEPSITNAILGVDRGEAVPVCFLNGHGERGLGDREQTGLSAAGTALSQVNYEVRIVNLSAAGDVPEDCRVVVIAGPENDITEPEAEALNRYLAAHGRLLAMIESRTDVPRLAGLLEPYGVVVNNDFVIDTQRNGQAVGLGIQVPMVDAYEAHPITDGFRQMTLYNLPRSFTLRDPAPAEFDVRALASSTRSSWGETRQGGSARWDEGEDLVGPLPLVVAVAHAVEESAAAYRARMRSGEPKPVGDPILVAFGDVDFASNALFQFQGDGDLLLNSVSWLAGEEDLISIMPKRVANKRIVMDDTDKGLAFVFLVLLLPAIPAVAGVVVMIKKVK